MSEKHKIRKKDNIMKGKKILISLLAAAVAAGTMAFPAFAAFETVEKLSETDVLGGYSALTEDGTIALSSAEAFETSRDAVTEYTTDTVVYNVSGKVTVNGTSWVTILKASATGVENVKTVKFIGLTSDAEINIANGPTLLAWQGHALNVEFENLTLSNSDPKWVGDAGHATNYFTAWLRCTDAANCSVSYKNCTLTNGSCNNQYGKTVYTDCSFNNASEYCLWLYGGVTEVTGTENTFVGKKGVKVYSEDENATGISATIENAKFEISDKPAVVSSMVSTITLNNVDASKCANGLLYSEPKDGRSDLEYADITVDGKAPVFAAKVGTKFFTSVDGAKNEAGSTGTVEAVIAQIGSNCYTSLEDAMLAACNMNVETVDGIPTQTAPVTIELLADLENQAGFYVRGGEKLTTYGSHYVHNIDITLNGNGYKIDTGVYGCQNPDVKGSPKIGFASMNGKFTVKNVIAPNDLVFDVSKTYDDVLSECSQRESGQAESLTVENCTFYGSNIAYAGAVNSVIYRNNKFLLTENENNGADSYPLWYKFNNAIKSFVFEGNTVKAERALNLARFAEKSEIVVNNNNFKIKNSEEPAKSAAIMLAENHTETSPFTGTVSFTGNIVDGHTGVLVYSPSEYNTNFDLSAASNTLLNGASLVGYNEWSGAYNDAAAKEAAEALVKKVEENANNNADYADTIKLLFKQVDENDNTLYNIVLSGNGMDINRLNAAEFKFALTTTDAITYEIAAADGLALIPQAEGMYEFHFDGKDFTGGITDTGAEIVIGTVKFEGYGKFTFFAETGRATATTTEDNLVTEFVVGGDAGKGTLVIGEDENKIEGEIKVPKQILTINIAMNHPVTDNVSAYQDMKVVISGGDLAGETLTFDLGTEEGAYALVNSAYKFDVELTQNRLYTVTVSGAGYRTARYTVAMTEDKTMNFWNNVMSNEITVVDDVKDTVNFLAGDIVKDGKINIYDLSAVVAYFGTENNQAEYSKFAKYDLNRDGKIDMMDISIVLTSWGK